MSHWPRPKYWRQNETPRILPAECMLAAKLSSGIFGLPKLTTHRTPTAGDANDGGGLMPWSGYSLN